MAAIVSNTRAIWGSDYLYDANGSMTRDQNKGISAIAYNHLNLPKQVTKTTNDYLKYFYDASGRKVRQEVYNPSNVIQKKTDYDGEYIYENDILQFINTEEGRVIMTGTNPEYQYYLKDHLGNVRTTFTTRASKDVYTATFENATQTTEQAAFTNYSRVTADLFDHTDAGTTYDKAQLLNSGNGSQVGLAKSLSVMAGDTVQVDVYAKYFGTTGSATNIATFGAALLSAFNLPTPVGGETGTPSSGLTSFVSWAGGGGQQGSNTWPKGYLNIVVFDKDYNRVDFAFQQIDPAYVQTGATKMPHQLLSKTVYIKEAGYVYLYVSNEGSVQQDIYFDDMTVTHRKSPIIQQDDYYPFGLAYNSFVRSGAVQNKFGFNGQSERQDDLGLGWLQTTMRMLSPDLGRFWGIDQKADMFSSVSPMIFAYNNPIKFNDPLGLEGEDPNTMLRPVVIRASRITSAINYSWISQFMDNSYNPIERAVAAKYQKEGAAAAAHYLLDNRTIHFGMQQRKTKWAQGFERVFGAGSMAIGGMAVAAAASPFLIEAAVKNLPSSALRTLFFGDKLSAGQMVTNGFIEAGNQYISNGGNLSKIDVADVAAQSVLGFNSLGSVIFSTSVNFTPFNTQTNSSFGFSTNAGTLQGTVDAGASGAAGLAQISINSINNPAQRLLFTVGTDLLAKIIVNKQEQ